jgi:flagellar hook-associated protein 2
MASSVTSTGSSTSDTSSVPTFNGQSQYASSLQQELQRAVAMASLPMQTVQANVNTLDSQESALSSLATSFDTLESDIGSINSAVKGTPTATSSDTGIVTATASASALAGSYSITVDSIGSPAVAISNSSTTVTDPTSENISTSSSFTLSTVDSSNNTTDYTITPSSDNLQALAQAINSSGAPVQATIVNVGGSSTNYELALTSTDFSVQSMQLNDGTNDLLTTLNGGTPTYYSVPGSSGELEADSNQVTLAPGLTVNLLDSSSSAATVTVSQSYSQLSSALSTFANDYNSAMSAVTQQMGQSSGALNGQSIIYTMESMLSSISQYSSGSSGSVHSLVDLGLEVDQNGQMSFDSSKLSGLNMSEVQQFLGSTTTGGFLQTANNSLESLTNSSTGMIQVSVTSLDSEITSDNSQISTDQNNINQLQTTLTEQLSAADAAIAQLESQATYMTQLFQAEYPATSA